MHNTTSLKILLHKCKTAGEIITSPLAFLSKKKYLVFSSGFHTFSGYSKNLFMSLLSDPAYSGIVFWSCNSSAETTLLKELGISNYLEKYSFRWWIVLFNSKALFFTHDSTDISPFTFKWVKKINFWHGRPIKKIGFDSPVEMKWIRAKIANRINLPYTEWDFVFAHDQQHAKIIESCWGIQRTKIINKSPPAHTCTNEANAIYTNFCYVILYAPTFKEYATEYSLLCSPSLRKWLDNHNAVILFRGHPSRGKKLSDRERCDRIIDISGHLDLHSIFSRIDLLITDYSSIVFDYLTYKKPTMLMWDDLSTYRTTYELYLNESDVSPINIITSPDDIVKLTPDEIARLPSNPFKFNINQPFSKEDLHEVLESQ